METQTNWNPFKRTSKPEATAEATMDLVSPEDIRLLLETNVLAIVDYKELASVKFFEGEQTIVFEVKVVKSDLGKVIGKQGKTAQALRTILNCMAARARCRCVLEIVE
jgi:predicted RNA-binding protein YlqC (UPF0109 family)